MNDYRNLSGEFLEQWLETIIKQKLGFESFVNSTGQVSLKALNPIFREGEHLEFDGFLLIGKVCVVFEVTDEKGKPKDKIRKFLKNLRIFKDSSISLRERFSLCGVEDSLLDDFEEVVSWRYVFINTSDSFLDTKITPSNFSDYLDLKDDLLLVRSSDVDYLVQLISVINRFAKNEFLAMLRIPLSESEGAVSKKFKYLKATGKYITQGKEAKADTYLIKFKVSELLKMARVSRYEGIPFLLEEENESKYQRLLIGKKLNQIAKTFVADSHHVMFPNTLTLIANGVREEGDMLELPYEYSSIEVIDGQHRLFAYTHESISDNTRDAAEVMASVIVFRDMNKSQAARFSARVFCDINSNQAKVKNSLIYLIKYDVLKEHDAQAIAGKILLECDRSSRKALSGMLQTGVFRRLSPLNTKPVAITTIVDSDLVPFLKGVAVSKDDISDLDFERVFGESRDYYGKNYGKFLRRSKIMIESYFNTLKEVFKYDWVVNNNSLIHSSKYYSAFVRLLRYYLFDCGFEESDIKNKLELLKSEIDRISGASESESFPSSCNLIPPKNQGVNSIFEFLKSPEAVD